jgi:signal transduction histidine kinase/DNA-binding response OmpR family regulator/ligand-binding sensor domain-containing protein
MKIKATQIFGFKDRIPIRFFIIRGFLLLILSQMLYSQSTDLEFEHFTTADGLATNWMISCPVEQDAQGFIWVGSDHGLHKYDGYNFTVFAHNYNDSISISNNSINDIYNDSKGRLWIATNSGLNRWKPETESFIRYSFADSLGPIYLIYEDNNKNLLLVFYKALQKLDPETGIIKSYNQNDIDKIVALANNHILTAYLDKNNVSWLGAENGLIKYNPQTSELKLFDLANARFYNNSSKRVDVITEDLSGKLLLGGKNSLYYFDRKNESLESLRNLKNNSLSIFTPEIKSDYYGGYIFQSPTSKEYWIGIHQGGVNRFDSSGKLIKHYKKNFSHSIFEDRSGVLWLGTYSNGLYKANLSKSNFEPQGYGMNELNILTRHYIFGVLIDNTGNLWLGTAEKGLYKYNFESKELKQYSHKTGNAKGLGSDLITFIFMDSKSRIWVGTNRGLSLYNPNSDSFTTYYVDSKNSVSNFFVSSYEDSTGNLTFGIWKVPESYTIYYSFNIDEITGKSTFTYNPDYEPQIILKNNGGKIKEISIKTIRQYVPYIPQIINSTIEDKNGKIWFSTSKELFKYNPINHKYKRFTTKDGLPVNTIGGILEDDDGYLWIANSAGLLKLNPDDDSFINFGKEDGLTNNLFQEHKVACKSKSGLMYFGGFNGLTIIDPKRFKANTVKPDVLITGIKIFGKSVPITKYGILNESISLTKQIELAYNQNDITIEYVGLHYKNPKKNKYAYKLEPYEKEWKYVGNIRNAHYTNLSAGEYTFYAKASNSDGVWNEKGKQLSIIISPPWWETTWAYVSYGFIFVLTLYGIRRYELNRIKLKDKVKLDAAVLKEREETDKIKSRFFANISHEFRTPLTLIQGPAEKINSQTSDDVIKDSGIIKRNSKRLLQLVNQLLDLSKLEAGKLKLEAVKSNIVSFVKGIALSFESLSEEKDITLKIYPEKDLIEFYFDKEKMIKILSNILSNAFKFTPRDGKITISITEKHGDKLKSFVEIKIRDTGIGIPQEEIPKLFDRFYQVDSSFTKEYEGTGIGLALTKELVELHCGSISVQSEKANPAKSKTGLSAEQASWTEFTIYFPLGRDHLTDEEIVPDEKTNESKEPINGEDYNFSIKSKTENEVETDSLRDEKNIVLVVEDNYDMREYIKESLGEDYYTEEAINGEQGVRKAERIIPDLIISDMMMPKMDGNELTRILKNNEKTSHIPIIILTAKSGQGSKLEGLETGADDYLTKPFDIKELQIRVKNLINIRRKLQEKFSKIEIISTDKKESKSKSISDNHIKLRSIDEKFISKIQKIIIERISDEGFSTEELGNEIGMSRSQVFRKIKALTGKSPSTYVRSIRLLKAKGMIENGEGNISEIAYSVGFSSPIYFSKCFKDEFGYPPKNFIS